MLVERLFRWCGGDECSSKPDVFGPNCDYLLLSLHVGALVRGVGGSSMDLVSCVGMLVSVTLRTLMLLEIFRIQNIS